MLNQQSWLSHNAVLHSWCSFSLRSNPFFEMWISFCKWLANNRGVCLQAFPSFPSPSPHFHFLALVSFSARSKPKILSLNLFLLHNKMQMLAMQASLFQAVTSMAHHFGHFWFCRITCSATCMSLEFSD